MAHYNVFEKYISQALKKAPYLHHIFKYYYQYWNYLLYGKKKYSSINPLCKISFSSNDSFFGYYDHTPWSNNMKYFLSHNINSESIHLNLFSKFPSSTIIDTITIQKKFNFQQGIRPIWINDREIIFNNVLSNKLVASIYSLDNKTIKKYNYPIQEISNTKTIYFSIDYLSLEYLNPDYGYNIKDTSIKSFKTNGIIGFDYKNEEIIFHLNIDTIHSKSRNKNKINSADCEINHLSSSLFDDKFIFIYRSKNNKGYSDLFIYDYNKNNLKLLFSGDIVSHYCWIDKDNIFVYLGKDVYNQGFFKLNIQTSKITALNKELDRHGDGHPSISPNKEWIIYDSYPNKKRLSYLMLYNIKKDKLINIGVFSSAMKFHGYNRCDLHPRWSPDGNYISIDSTHSGKRKTYIIDVSKIMI